MGSSCWPFGAFVVGVNSGAGSWSAWRSPAGRRWPQTWPVLVGAPAAAHEVAAHDALDCERLEFFHDHAAELQVPVLQAAARELAGLVGQKMVDDEALRLRKPPQAHLREQDALARNAVGQDHVEGGKAVSGGEQERVAEIEKLADLAGANAGVGQVVDLGDGGGRERFGDFGKSHGFVLNRKNAKITDFLFLNRECTRIPVANP